jgi:RWD domain
METTAFDSKCMYLNAAKARGKENDSADTKAALKMCTSDSNAAEQQEEVEAITAIYPEEDIRLIRPAPLNISMPSACFSIQLIPKSGNVELIPPRWIGEISLLIEFPPGYPSDADSDPVITVEVGTLSMMDFPGSYKKALALTVVRFFD